jgi:hypothetical protein
VSGAGALPRAAGRGGATRPARPALDLEAGEPALAGAGVAAPPLPPLETVPYEHRVRGRIAERLIWLLVAVVGLAFASFWRISPPPAAGELKELLAVLFGPLVALVAAAVGYYFGGKSG